MKTNGKKLSVVSKVELDDKDRKILELEKVIAELQMDIIKQRYLVVRTGWKEKLRALGEPDPDELPSELPVALKKE